MCICIVYVWRDWIWHVVDVTNELRIQYRSLRYTADRCQLFSRNHAYVEIPHLTPDPLDQKPNKPESGGVRWAAGSVRYFDVPEIIILCLRPTMKSLIQFKTLPPSLIRQFMYESLMWNGIYTSSVVQKLCPLVHHLQKVSAARSAGYKTMLAFKRKIIHKHQCISGDSPW